MNLILNGESRSFEGITNLDDLVMALKLERGRIATELNFEVVPKKDYATTPLKDGDRIEIVTFVGGG